MMLKAPLAPWKGALTTAAPHLAVSLGPEERPLIHGFRSLRSSVLVGSLDRILSSVRLLGCTGFFRTIIELGGKGLDGPCPKFLGPFRFLMRQKFLDLQAVEYVSTVWL